MNYLAHLYLSQADAHSILGNIMGDFRKYLTESVLPENINAGMENHLRVDKFTDTHPVVIGLKDLFSPGRRRFAGIIIDIVFDHFLSRHWNCYRRESREDFISYSYDCLIDGWEYMPTRMQYAMHHMIHDDWLGSYIELAGISLTLDRMSRRIRFRNNLAGAITEIENNYPELEQGFLDFFPCLVNYVRQPMPIVSIQQLPLSRL